MLELLILTSIIIEWLIYFVPFLWDRRKYLDTVPIILTAYATTGLVVDSMTLPIAVVAFISLFRLINLLRIAENRMNKWYLLISTKRTGLILGGLQAIFLGINLLVLPDWVMNIEVLAYAQVVVAAGIFIVVLRNLQKSRHVSNLEHFSDKELPTVTIAIPARDETADMEDCIRSVLANNYPKFEVIVLDDNSHDDTPDIIKSFAHDGVRFIKGHDPEDRWLAKNQAYDQLASEATGEFILFCGVDVRFGTETIRALVTTMLNRKKDMISILPRRLTSDVLAALIQPMRYWWELALPRRYFNRPPVLSTCFVIRRKTLKKLGGFKAVQHAIVPEGFFARELVKSDKYSFIRADDILDVQTRKRLEEQRKTAIRMRYPEARRRPEWVMFILLGEILFLAVPFVLLASTIWHEFEISQMLAMVSCILLVLTHVTIVQVSNPANVLVAIFNYPLVIITEIIIGLTSMYKYEFSSVEWKGRSIQGPVMHVIPKLPEI